MTFGNWRMQYNITDKKALQYCFWGDYALNHSNVFGDILKIILFMILNFRR